MALQLSLKDDVFTVYNTKTNGTDKVFAYQDSVGLIKTARKLGLSPVELGTLVYIIGSDSPQFTAATLGVDLTVIA